MRPISLWNPVHRSLLVAVDRFEKPVAPRMTDLLQHFGLERSPFADEPHASSVIGTRALRKLVARIQAALRDRRTRIGVCGVAGIGKSSLAVALPKLFAGNTRVATLLDPSLAWPEIRLALARDWRLGGERLSRKSLLEAAGRDRLVIVVDRAEEVSDSLLGHLEVLQEIQDADGKPAVTVILFVHLAEEVDAPKPAALEWLSRSEAALLRFEPLSPDSVADYIERRLRRAGYRGAPLFTPRAALAIHAETNGVPGAVSRLCDQLLTDAAARRLRSIDEPFVRTRQETPRARCAMSADDSDGVWDDADHHPRETSTPELLLEHAVAPVAIGGEIDSRAERGVRPASDAIADPALEAFLSAPPTAAELRAIRGGFVRRFARPFTLASAAVALGGLLLALILRSGSQGSTAGDDARAATAALDSAGAFASGQSPGPRVAGALEGSEQVAISAEGVVLGRIRGPVAATADPPMRKPKTASSPSSIAEAMGRANSPLTRAGDIVEDDGDSSVAGVTTVPDPVSDLPDLRPPNLAPPARIDDPDL
jgi:MSHA biogenesis protein MshM